MSALLSHFRPGRDGKALAGALQRLQGFRSMPAVSKAAEVAPEPVPISRMTDSFLDGTSNAYLEELEQRYRDDPSSVDGSWASFFRNIDAGVDPEAVSEAYYNHSKGITPSLHPLSAASVSNQSIQESMRLMMLIRAYQVSGHFHADLDPLKLTPPPPIAHLDPALYGFSQEDMDREFFLGNWNMKGFLSEDRPVRTLREVLTRLKETYCGTIGFEYMHINDREKCNWLRERIELADRPEFSRARRIHMLDRLAWSDMFETFCANKFTAAKRFGLEGCETLIPGMKAMIDRAAQMGMESVVIGMPHRGRLNMLANVVRKPLAQIFSEFGGIRKSEDGQYTGSGDVKYHLGTSYDRPTVGGKMVHMSLMANPSHLEAVNTVVVGKCRAKQFYSGDTERTRCMPVLLHGDGAFAGQGVVYETLDMAGLYDYTVGGTIHVVVNNQVAFTTDPKDSRSSPYCTDVGKGMQVPIFHVNGDDVEAVVHAFEMAAQWRQTWHADAIIDIVCYRKHGHNEIDEPFFTQPLMYSVIKGKKNALQQYSEKLLEQEVLTKDELRALQDAVQEVLQREYAASGDFQPSVSWLSSQWKGFNSPSQLARIRNTGVPSDVLQEVGSAVTTIPDDFAAHRQIAKVYAARREAISAPGQAGLVDWALAEALAFGTLIAEGNHVRLSGQDVERGTFSHRHAMITDQKTGAKYCSLDHVSEGQVPGMFTVSNSCLNEYGVLGYELGYSMEDPNQLILWEAQFGDFANTAQVIFDQFLASGEAKWLRQTGLTVLLPHGYDGQGPEHSSARLERFLQMSDEDPFTVPPVDEALWFSGGHLGTQVQDTNWQVVNCTTPANYFHVLRRQVHRRFRKPLMIFTPKNLLRHPKCKSPLLEFDDQADDKNIQGARFKRLIMDKAATDRGPHPPVDEHTKRVIFCTGKIYYELDAAREEAGKESEIAICRVEQLAPFPFDLVMREMRRYPGAEVMWCQEEPMNMGAYHHVTPRFQSCARELGKELSWPLPYAGRGPAASTATGFGEVHAEETAALLEGAMKLD